MRMPKTNYNVEDIANYIIYLANKDKDEDFGIAEGITQLKLQKILYFVQAASLVYLDKKAFDDPILARKYGPVVESIFEKYKEFKREPLSVDKGWKPTALGGDIKSIIKKVWYLLGAYSASRLVDMTHQHTPRIKTNQGEEIPVNDIKSFYSERLTL